MGWCGDDTLHRRLLPTAPPHPAALDHPATSPGRPVSGIPNAADPGPHMALIAVEPCGCTAYAVVLGYGHDDDAYREAAREVKRGCRIEHVEVDKWKAENKWHCSDHPKGPPWWKSNGGNGKRPAEYAAPMGLGL